MAHKTFRRNTDDTSSSLTTQHDTEQSLPNIPFGRTSRGDAEILKLLEESKELALESQGVGVSHISFAGQLMRIIWILIPHPDASHHQHTAITNISLAELRPHVARALKDFYFPHRLSQNKLTDILNLERHYKSNEPQVVARGYALQRALNEAIDLVLQHGDMEIQGSTPGRFEQYLHLRYRQEQSHKQVASKFGFSDRHMRRLRDELLDQVARLLVEMN